MSDGPADAPPAPPPRQANPLALLTDIGAVAGVVTALLFYYGWVRTRVEAQEVGYDVSVLDLSVTDYVLKSLNVLFLPVVVIVVMVFPLHAVHRHWIRPWASAQPRRRAVLRVARTFLLSWVIWLLLVVPLSATPIKSAVPALAFTLATLCALYGRTLWRLATGVDPWHVVTRVLVLIMLAGGVFWTAERIARFMGRAFAEAIRTEPETLARVTVFSTDDLHVQAAGITESCLAAEGARYRCRYTGFRLLTRSGDRYLLLTGQQRQVVMLRESPDIRFEFSRDR